MTNLQTYQTEIEGDIQRFKTAVRFAQGSEEEIAEAVDRAWAVLNDRASEVRSKYAAFREETIAGARKQAALNPVSYEPWDRSTAKNNAHDVIVDLIAANDATEQNAVLKKLEDTLRYFSDGQKRAFRPQLIAINGLLIDKAASKASLKAVINEIKNVAKPYDDALAEAEALPTVIGEEYDTLKAEREAE
ncbi:hypothetical protein MHZ92_19955 [Sporosarcina sp. ACRSL]|uniref:hypothetical protein n=1 Tax=Sporosarcina sp. ACRSL TaxID=2918215 RepID=UPI001EF6EE92|nr:hypothetical protein [Sporosarcina sp. ACRSL]MCG7346383.1 hypothetical protein [Sporosarcina sp. ACRSL]